MALAWHRRAGKDELLLNAIGCRAMMRPASYGYMFPTTAHARRSMWNSVNPHTGRRRILESFPSEMLAKPPNETEMRIEFINGSNLVFFGSDNYDGVVGAAFAGLASSEHALASPNAYAFFSPMLLENKGFFWAISTPRGRNHFKSMVDYAAGSKKWFSQILPISITKAVNDDDLKEELEKFIHQYGIDEGTALFNQEYMVDFNAAVLGAFFSHEMVAVRNEERIVDDLEPIDAPVHRAWDLGMRDDTTIWFWQAVGSQVYILDVYSTSGVGIEHYAGHIDQLYQERGWKHGIDFVPHDAKVKELGTGRTRVEAMQSFGLNPRLAPNAGLMDGINAARQTLKRCVFHERCDMGIQALELYRREYDEDKRVFRSSPLHDWTSHYADSFRYMSLSWREMKPEPPPKPEPIAHPAQVALRFPTNRGRKNGTLRV